MMNVYIEELEEWNTRKLRMLANRIPEATEKIYIFSRENELKALQATSNM